MADHQTIFISYARADMKPTDWLSRLKRHLAPLRSHNISPWDDSQIAPGTEWRPEIDRALKDAGAAILLVGPGYLASDFIVTVEIPRLLEAARTAGVRILPLVVRHCLYETSALGPFQAFNGLKPLAGLTRDKQDEILRDISKEADEALRRRSGALAGAPQAATAGAPDLTGMLARIQRHLSDAHKAYGAQCKRRNDLVAGMKSRLGVAGMQYERFFIRYYTQMTEAERFEFDQIRAFTEGPMVNANRAILEILKSYPALLHELPILDDLQQHLDFWINKYERVFVKTPGMCVLYTGVEDGVPFPGGVDDALAVRLAKSRAKATGTE